jgi:hypothetical protein
MQIKRLNNSATSARYQIDYDCIEDTNAGLYKLVDRIEPYNYGYNVVDRPSDSRVIVDIYID